MLPVVLGWEDCLQHDLFCVESDIKTENAPLVLTSVLEWNYPYGKVLNIPDIKDYIDTVVVNSSIFTLPCNSMLVVWFRCSWKYHVPRLTYVTVCCSHCLSVCQLHVVSKCLHASLFNQCLMLAQGL